MGIKSKRQGELAERLFETALNQYQSERMLIWHKNFPEFVPLKKGPGGYITGYFKEKSGPDYSILARDFGAALVEVKLFSALNVKSYGLSLHQYNAMREAYQLGFMAGYLILWQNRLGEQWTFHRVSEVDCRQNEERYKLVFSKKDGLMLENFNGGVPEIAPIFDLGSVYHYD